MEDSVNYDVCEKCGGRTEYRRGESWQGLLCAVCDWGAVTSYASAIDSDSNTYSLYVRRGYYQNPSHVRALAALRGVNYLSARSMLRLGSFMACEGKANTIASALRKLTEVGIEGEVLPPFAHVLRPDQHD